MCVQCDICRLLVSEAVKHLGGIDILILNAAYIHVNFFADTENPVSDYIVHENMYHLVLVYSLFCNDL